MPADIPHTVIPLACLTCGHDGRAALPLAGRAIPCPGCTARLTVPQPPPQPCDTVPLKFLPPCPPAGKSSRARPEV
jgi:hypothetical protein